MWTDFVKHFTWGINSLVKFLILFQDYPKTGYTGDAVRNKTRRVQISLSLSMRMSPADHNKTLVVLYSLISALFTLPLLIAPLILLVSPSLIAKNLKSTDQVLIATVAYCFVVLLALLFPVTGYSLYKRKSVGRSLALISAVALLPVCWPLGVYTWWFMHSEGGKTLYSGLVD